MTETAKNRFNKHIAKLKKFGKTRFTVTISETRAREIAKMSKDDKQLFLSVVFPHALERFTVISESRERLKSDGHSDNVINDYINWSIGLDGATSEYLTLDQFFSDNDWHNRNVGGN